MANVTITLRGLSRRQLLIGLGGAVLAVALAVGVIIYIRERTTLVGLPRESYQGLSFAVFFPRHAPGGFSFDRDSVSVQPQVLAYSYHYQGNKPVYVSIQPLDPSLDVNSFRPTRELDIPIGHGYLAVYDTRTTIAILAGKSLVLINSPDGVSDAAVEQFAGSLRAVR